MAMSKRTRKSEVHPLDREPYRSMLQQTTDAAIQALARFGEPSMSLEELRAALKAELGDISLSEEIIKNRL
jgi:hypothetical protein